MQDCNFDCNDSGIALQAMDNSHVALVSMMLKSESFSPFRCDRNIALGINLTSLQKVLRCAQNEDILTLKAEDAPDVVNMVFESSDSDRISEYDIKLMDIDQEHLGIPETEYAATIAMPSSEFQRICRDLTALSESGKSSLGSAVEPQGHTLTLDVSRNRVHERGCHVQVQRRHRLWSGHTALSHRHRQAGEKHRDQPLGASGAHLFAQIPCQLLQS